MLACPITEFQFTLHLSFCLIDWLRLLYDAALGVFSDVGGLRPPEAKPEELEVFMELRCVFMVLWVPNLGMSYFSSRELRLVNFEVD